MWWKRRPAGTAGLPDRASEKARVSVPKNAAIAIGAIGVVLAVLYPAFGVSLLVVIGAEVLLGQLRGGARSSSSSER